MSALPLVVRGRRVVLPGGARPAAVHVQEGRVSLVAPYEQVPSGVELVEAGDLVVMPGLVDAHVHVNQPGRTEWEGFETATRAAAAGGATTIVDMPLNSIPPTVDVEALWAKRAEAQGLCSVDVAFWGGLVAGSEEYLTALAAAGVCGLKAFLVDSGVAEFPPIGERLLRRVLPVLAELGLPLLVHAEDPTLIRAVPAGRSYAAYLATRPSAAEERAVELVVLLARETGAHLHVLHLASGPAMEVIRRAKSERAPVTAETCPHYLFFSAEEIPEGATAFKCAPPIRQADHREALWEGMADGTIDMVVSDHSPAPAEIKELESGDFGRAWGGISSLQVRLAVTWTAARERGFRFEDLARWLAEAPARLAGLDHKGTIEAGKDADLVIWDPDTELTVDPARLEHRHPVTPYAGRRLAGGVEITILRGRVIFRDGRVVGPPAGDSLRRPHQPA